MATRLPKRYGFDPKGDIQVLTPMRRGLIGTDNLNRRLQAVFSPENRRMLRPVSARRQGHADQEQL